MAKKNDEFNFYTSVLQNAQADLSVCVTCGQSASGAFGPEGHEFFYCSSCWKSYFQGLKQEEKEEWLQSCPRRKVSCDGDKKASRAKSVMLAAAGFGATVWFPENSLNSFQRRLVHQFREEEPELKGMMTKSYGKGAGRFLLYGPGDAGWGSSEPEQDTEGELALLKAQIEEYAAETQKCEDLPLEVLKTLRAQLLLGLASVSSAIAEKQRACQAKANQKSESVASKDGGSAKAKSTPSTAAAPKASSPTAQAAKAKPQPAPPATPPPTKAVSPAAPAPRPPPGPPPQDQGDFPALGSDFPSLGATAAKKKGSRK